MQLFTEHTWSPHGDDHNHHDRPGRWTIYPDPQLDPELRNFFVVDLEYRKEQVRSCLEGVEAIEQRPARHRFGHHATGVVASGPDGAAYSGNGYVLVASDYADWAQVLLTATEFRRIIEHVLATMEHPDYRNPEATQPFANLTIELIMTGEGCTDEYYKRGGITPAFPNGRT